MARPQILTLITVIIASFLSLCTARFIPHNGNQPRQSPSTSAAASPKGTFTGDITHYAVGQGSCGSVNSNSEAVVALSTAMMANGPNPNTNPKCQTMITLVNPRTGSRTKAKVVDTCEGCAYGDVDLSPTLFKTVAPKGDGRVKGIQWSFDS